MTDREALHAIVEQLPECELENAYHLLESVQAKHDPILRAFLEAPIDDEPLTEEDIAAIEEAKQEVARGEVISWEDLKRELADFP